MNKQGATLLLLSEASVNVENDDTTFWVDGIIRLEYTPAWRKISVSKFRGSDFMHGNHAFKITGEGTLVFPRLKPGKYERKFLSKPISSGIEEIDNLLHGGLERGTITMITGPTGVGKTNLGTQFINEAASRNERSAIYTFEESKELIIRRSKMVNIPIESMLEKGTLKIVTVEPFSYSPDEFSQMVRDDIEKNGTKIVMIDSMGGYSLAVREEDELERLHTLTVYLQNMGVTGLLTNESSNVTGEFKATNMQASYLADNIIFLRYIEIEGELRKTIGVLKKRLSDFERTIRELNITSDGIQVGEKLTNLRGILSGSPELVK
jgi:circadian clock protein KaiC